VLTGKRAAFGVGALRVGVYEMRKISLFSCKKRGWSFLLLERAEASL